MLDRLTSMQVFLAVVRHGTFAGAATELGLSRAMASKHIAALEAHLGVRLFNRTTRVTRLTEAGQHYFARVDDLMAELSDLETRLSEDSGRISGHLALAAPPAFGAFHLAPVVAAFMRQHPGIQVSMTLTERAIDMVDEAYDLLISVRELEDSNLIARRLSAVRMKICATPEYLEQHALIRRPEDLQAHNCLIFSAAAKIYSADWQFQRRGAAFSVRVTGDFCANVGDALREVALSSAGVVRLPSYIVREDLAAGRLVNLLSRFSPPLRPVYALYPHRDYIPGKVRSFLDFAVTYFAADKRRRAAG